MIYYAIIRFIMSLNDLLCNYQIYKRKIVGVDDVTYELEYNKVEDMTPFAVEVDTSILLAEEEAPYACHDHNEGTIVK